MAASLNKFRLALVQMAVGANKTENLQKATLKIHEAAKNGAQVISIPECFNSPYGTKYFGEYSEPIPDGPSCQVLQKAARENKIYLIGGSIPEEADGKLYNTATVWCPEGNLLAVHRKIHLFDIDVPGKITFKESEVLSRGNSFTSFDTPWCKVGLGICYDIRFAELGMIYRDIGCKLLVYPGAFNMITGPAHIDTLVKSRALDNQVYVAFASPARDETAEYVAYANSAVASPWGEIVTQADEKETIIYTDIDLEYSNTIRSQIPISFQRRGDMYSVHNNLNSPPETRRNQKYQLDSKKVVETFNVDDLGKKTVFCRCWESKKFPLCDGAHGKHNQRCGDNLGPIIITKSE